MSSRIQPRNKQLTFTWFEGNNGMANTRGAGLDPSHTADNQLPAYPHPLASCLMPVIAMLAIMGLSMLALTIWQKSMPKNVTVPIVIGLPVAQAQDKLQQAGLDFEVRKETQPSETVPEGSVLSIAPMEGRIVKAGRTIKIILSSGTAYSTVPDVRNQTKDAAYTLLGQEELTVEAESSVYDATIPENCVIDISPKAGTKVAVHSTVKLVISKGAPPETSDSPGTNEIVSQHTFKLTINVPTDATSSDIVRVVVTDVDGSREVYRKVHAPGDTFVYSVKGHGDSTAEVYFGKRDFMTQIF